MLLTSGYAFRGFAEQKSFSFTSDMSISNTSGNSNIAISGDGGIFNLMSFNRGRIYDCSNRFIGAYSSDESLYVSGDFSSGDFGYFINNKPICLKSTVCSSSLSFDNLFFKTSGADFNFLVNIFGQEYPNYEFVLPSQPQITGSKITGYLKNISPNSFQSFKLFSGSCYFPDSDYVISSNISGIRIKPNQSGEVVFDFKSGKSFSTNSYKQVNPITGHFSFYSNFGNSYIPILLPLKSSPFYNINFENSESGLLGGTGQFWSFDLTRQACSGTRFEFLFDDIRWLETSPKLFSNSLSVKTGYNNTGYVPASVAYNTSRGAYVCTGYLSGAGCSGSDDFSFRFGISHSAVSGIKSNKFKYMVSGVDEKFIFSGIIEE